MPAIPPQSGRRSLRLRDYDYAQAGAYFVTICTRHRVHFFENPVIRTIAEQCWLAIPEHVPFVELDEWVVMPNHVHGIIVINHADNDFRRADASNEARSTGVQLNAPAPHFIAESGETDAPHRTGVQLNAPASHFIVPNAGCEDCLDHPDESTDLGDHRGTGVQLNAPASHFIAEFGEINAAHRTDVQLNAPASRSGAPNDHTNDSIDGNDEHDDPHRTGVQLNAPALNRNALQCNNDVDAIHGHLPARHPNNRYSMISPHRNTLAVLVRTYKAAVTMLCRRSGYADFAWQRNYHERIIREEYDLNQIRQYILDNPRKWEQDQKSR